MARPLYPNRVRPLGPAAAGWRERGAALVEVMAALAVFSLVALALFQIQALALATRQRTWAAADVHRALRQVLAWLEDDARMARQASISGGLLVLEVAVHQDGGCIRRFVRYSLEEGRLIRELRDGAGRLLQRQEVAVGVHGFEPLSYSPQSGLLAYRVAVRPDRQRAPVAYRGTVLLRNRGLGCEG